MRTACLVAFVLLAACPDRHVTAMGAAAMESAPALAAQPKAAANPRREDAGISPECARALAVEAIRPASAPFEPVVLSLEGDGIARRVPFDQFVMASRDGKTLAVLSTDSMDFTGWTVQTLRFLRAPSGRTEESFVLNDGTDKQTVAGQNRTLAQAQARLATSTWQMAVPSRRPTGSCPGSVWASLDAKRSSAGGDSRWERSIRFDSEHLDVELISESEPGPQKLHFRHTTTSAEREATVPVAFPTGCGFPSGLEKGFLIPVLNAVVLFPSVFLGGDSCVGNLAIDNALVVPIPAVLR